MISIICFIWMITLLNIQGITSQELTLEPKTIDEQENENVTLLCTTHSLVSYWTNSDQIYKWSPLLFHEGQCLVSGFLNDSSAFSWNCHRNGSFSLTILHINERQHNISWRCRGLNFTPTSNIVTVFIKVRVKKVEITTPDGSSITVVENMHTLLRCRTSYSRPTPSINWFMQLKGNVTQINASSSSLIFNERGFESVTSVLNISVNKEEQEAELYCSGANGFDEVLSRSISFEVFYTPDGGPYIEQASNNSIYTLKENSTCSLTCAIPWGNPLPQLSWNCSGLRKYSYEDKKKVRLNLRWQIKRYEDRDCTCTSMHELAGIQTSSVRIEVLFPSEITSFSITSISSNKTNVINKTESAEFLCIAEANPSSNLTIENPRGDTISEVSESNFVRLTLRNATCYDAGEYTCTGQNKFTRGLSARFEASLIIKCPPRPSSEYKSSLKIATRLHVGVTLHFVARKYLEEPNKTVFKWLKGNIPISTNDSNHIVHSNGLQTFLFIRNVSHEDLGFYQVHVRNSAGEYVHYYELIVIAELKEKSQMNLPSRTGAFVGVGIGACFSTLVIVTLAFGINKRLKKSDMICDKRFCRQGNTGESQVSVKERNQTLVAYTDLKNSKRDVNVYDEVIAQATLSHEHVGSDSKRKITSMEIKDKGTPTKESPEYINTAI